MAAEDSALHEVALLRQVVDRLTTDKAALERENEELRRENSSMIEDSDDVEDRVERAEDLEEAAIFALRMVYDRTLIILKRLEFSNNSKCPLCMFDWSAAGKSKPTHTGDCDLKLEIFRLDMDLVKVQYA